MKFLEWQNELKEEVKKKHKTVIIKLFPDGYEIWGQHKYLHEQTRLLEPLKSYPELCLIVANSNDPQFDDYLFKDDLSDYIMGVKQFIQNIENFFENNQ